jgi:hypothetical protein
MNLDHLFASLGALDRAVSNATLRTYRRTVRSFAGVCATEGSEIFPASEFNLLRWINSLSKTCRPITIRGYLVSLRTVHSVMEWPWMGDAISIQHALRKQHRRYGSAQRQTLGIIHEMRDAMIDATDPSSLEGVMHWSLCGAGWDFQKRQWQEIGTHPM